MKLSNPTTTAALHPVLLFFCLCLLSTAGPASGQTQNAASVSATNTANTAITEKKPLASVFGKTLTNPGWQQLDPEQKNILAPLSEDWNSFEPTSKEKWLQIAARYKTMKPEEQQRMQSQMRDWAKLTPEQRRAARENYRKVGNLPKEKKQARWEAYQQLPPEKKQELVKHPVVLKKPVAPPTGNISKPGTTLPTIQTHKPAPREAAIQNANRAPVRPSPQPERIPAPDEYSADIQITTPP